MKSLLAVLAFLAAASGAFAQPDPRDSVVLESKTVLPGSGGEADTSAYLYVKVYITNKDSLTFLALSMLESSTSGGAYAILGRPRTFVGVITPLTPSFRYGKLIVASNYHSDSPDSFVVGAGWDGGIGETSIEPPNVARKAVWEFKFDSVWNNLGTIELDTVSHPNLEAGAASFTNTAPQDMPANFVKSVITVSLFPRGDLNQDVALSPADVVWILNCVMLGPVPPAGSGACDLNCDGMGTAADVVLELNAVFLGQEFPC